MAKKEKVINIPITVKEIEEGFYSFRVLGINSLEELELRYSPVKWIDNVQGLKNASRDFIINLYKLGFKEAIVKNVLLHVIYDDITGQEFTIDDV